MINKYHIWIKECCASCWYKIIRDEKGRRFCRKVRQVVPGDGWCREWKLSKGLEQAGRGGGTVKVISERSDDSITPNEASDIWHRSSSARFHKAQRLKELLSEGRAER